jgi:hypothetical protein
MTGLIAIVSAEFQLPSLEFFVIADSSEHIFNIWGKYLATAIDFRTACSIKYCNSSK